MKRKLLQAWFLSPIETLKSGLRLRPGAKRKLLIAAVFLLSYGLLFWDAIISEPQSLQAWGAVAGLTLTPVLAWPYILEFLRPSGLDRKAKEHVGRAVHRWRFAYMIRIPEFDEYCQQNPGGEVWGRLTEFSELQEPTPENLTRFRPLLCEEAVATADAIEKAIQKYQHVLSDTIQAAADEAENILRTAHIIYRLPPEILSGEYLIGPLKDIIHHLSRLLQTIQK